MLDNSAQTLFLTEMFRGMSLTLKYFFEKKVTVRRGVRGVNLRAGECRNSHLCARASPLPSPDKLPL